MSRCWRKIMSRIFMSEIIMKVEEPKRSEAVCLVYNSNLSCFEYLYIGLTSWVVLQIISSTYCPLNSCLWALDQSRSRPRVSGAVPYSPSLAVERPEHHMQRQSLALGRWHAQCQPSRPLSCRFSIVSDIRWETYSHQADPFLCVGESCVWIACAVPHCKSGLMNILDNDLDPASVRAGSKVLRIVSALKIWFSTVLPAKSSVLTYDLQQLGFSTHHWSATCRKNRQKHICPYKANGHDVHILRPGLQRIWMN